MWHLPLTLNVCYILAVTWSNSVPSCMVVRSNNWQLSYSHGKTEKIILSRSIPTMDFTVGGVQSLRYWLQTRYAYICQISAKFDYPQMISPLSGIVTESKTHPSLLISIITWLTPRAATPEDLGYDVPLTFAVCTTKFTFSFCTWKFCFLYSLLVNDTDNLTYRLKSMLNFASARETESTKVKNFSLIYFYFNTSS